MDVERKQLRCVCVLSGRVEVCLLFFFLQCTLSAYVCVHLGRGGDTKTARNRRKSKVILTDRLIDRQTDGPSNQPTDQQSGLLGREACD